jgi:hypothetical protein
MKSFLCWLALIANGGFMQQVTSPVDPEFVAPLKGNISGVYYSEVERFTVAKIQQEFRKAVADSKLLDDEKFVFNLMFLVRKKPVPSLVEDVRRVLDKSSLKPSAAMSTLKTLFAFGLEKDRNLVDDRLSTALKGQLQSIEALSISPYLAGAERIGGPKTLAVLKQGAAGLTERQRQAEQHSPRDHMEISRLDQVRSNIENKSFILARKLDILAMPEAKRALEFAKNYLRNMGHLGIWSHQLLVASPAEATVTAVCDFISHQLETLLPSQGLSAEQRAQRLLDARLRGLCLLQAMKVPLNETEQELLQHNASRIESSEEFFRPQHDWEDVLDGN